MSEVSSKEERCTRIRRILVRISREVKVERKLIHRVHEVLTTRDQLAILLYSKSRVLDNINSNQHVK